MEVVDRLLEQKKMGFFKLFFMTMEIYVGSKRLSEI